MVMEITMVESSDEFFEGKRPWSKIKDEVLGNYMTPYLAKVNTRGQPILLIDGYAGQGFMKKVSADHHLSCVRKPKNGQRITTVLTSSITKENIMIGS
jgi:hypothetical protein